MTFTLTPSTVTGLLVMDVDSGPQCQLLREAADENRNGVLDPPEVRALDRRLAAMLTRNLKLGVSGAPIPLRVTQTKLSLRDDLRTFDAGFSVAVLLEAAHPHAISEGMQFEVQNVSPDLSALAIEVLQVDQPPVLAEVASGAWHRVRFGRR